MFLAYAEKPDSSEFSLLVVMLVCIGLAAAVGGLALLPIGLASSRKHRHRDGILTATCFWVLLAIGSLVYAANAQLKWSRERDLRFQSGYYTASQEAGDAPDRPWQLWAILALIYAGLVIWGMSGSKPPSR